MVRRIKLRTTNEVLKEVHSKFYRKLVSYCKALGLTTAEAEDCVQEVFIRFWLNSSALINLETSKQKAWLYKAGSNVAHEILRKREKIDNSDISENKNEPHDITVKIENFVESDTYSRLIEASRAEFISTDIENKIFNIMISGERDLGYKQLSDKYGIKSSTLRSQVRRLRLKLMESLPDFLDKL